MKPTIAFCLLCLTGVAFSGPPLFTKAVEKNLMKVSDNLYANRYETTNAEYRAFLEAQGAGAPDYLGIRNENWLDGYGDPFKDHYHSYPGFDQFPVLNITHRAAEEYCRWLTDRYNADPQRKFKRVVFRLPTEAEWLSAAQAGDPEAIYPWGNKQLRSKDGLLLCNYYAVDETRLKMNVRDRTAATFIPLQRPNQEMLKMPAAVFSFEPNALGLHNMSGNAAEMLAEEGRTKGGSWASSGYYVRLDAEDEFLGFSTSVYVGFRYFMEVVEK